jgi:hypothetical protein
MKSIRECQYSAELDLGTPVDARLGVPNFGPSLPAQVPPVRIAARAVKDGPCKEVVLTGKDINLFDFPAP